MKIRSFGKRLGFALAAGCAAWALGLAASLAGHIGTMQTSNTTFDVTATVPVSCSFSTGNLSFGTYTGSTLNAQATTDVVCTAGAAWEVEYGPGLWSVNNDCFTRRMAATDGIIPLAFLTYTIADGQGGALLGQVSEKPACTTHTGMGPLQKPVYGEIGAGQSPRAAGYADQITVTLHF